MNAYSKNTLANVPLVKWLSRECCCLTPSLFKDNFTGSEHKYCMVTFNKKK